MQLSNKGIAAAGIVWIATVAGAYYLGHREPESIAGSRDKAGNVIGGPGGGTAGKFGGKGSPGGSDKTGAEAPMTLKQILAKLKVSMRGGAMQNPTAMMKAMALIDKIRPEDLQEALSEAEAMTDQQQKMVLVMSLLAKWAEKDGPAAMKYAVEHSKGGGIMSQLGKMSVASAWAEHDPEAVWKWYKESGNQEGGGLMGGDNLMLTSLFTSLAGSDLDLAFKRLDEIDGPGKQMALAGMFQSTLFDDDKRAQILKKVESLPDPEERKQAKQMMMGQFAMLAPDQAMEWLKTQPPEDQKEMRETMGTMFMMSDPKKGAAMLLEGATDETKPKAYSTIISQWAAMDTNAAGTWLREQPQGAHLDEARSSFVRIASSKDPQSAMVWAGTITDPDSRVSATRTAYKAWHKKDAAAAEQALNTSGLTAEQMESVKSDGPRTPEAVEIR